MTIRGEIRNAPPQLEEEKKLETKPHFRKLEFGVQLLTLLIATIAAMIYGFQWYQMRKSLEVDQRPWIRISEEVKPFDEAKPEEIYVRFHLLNSGKTPATHFDARFFVEKVQNGKEPILSEAHFESGFSMGAMFPAEPEDIVREMYRLTPTELEDYKSGKVFFVIYTKATYTDFFKIDHWTKRCAFISLVDKMDPSVHSFSAKRCTDDYNDIDNNQ